MLFLIATDELNVGLLLELNVANNMPKINL